MIRRFSLVALDESDRIEDMFNLNIVTNPRGLGFAKEVQTVQTEIEEIIVKAVQRLEDISLQQNCINESQYEQAKALRLWIQTYANRNTALLWQSNKGAYICDCHVVKYEFSEIVTSNYMPIPLTLKTLSPWFELKEQLINISPSGTRNVYPRRYPIRYGTGMASNNMIINDYPKDAPVTITLYGNMVDVGISIRVLGEAIPYARVQFPNVSLQEGHSIIINARRGTVRYFNGSVYSDFFGSIDPTYQSFIRAKANMISELESSGVRPDLSGYMLATYRRYMQ